MARQKGSPGSLAAELLQRSREAALAAVRSFNDPQAHFKSETFIVLMIIAWTYLLHAHYRKKRVDFRYFRVVKGRRRFDRTARGSYKLWELERCLNDTQSPVDKDAANNLRFLIGLRHEIEHQMTRRLDSFLSARYHACAINYNDHVKRLFGSRHGLDQHLGFSIQFVQLSPQQLTRVSSDPQIPDRLQAYISDFDGTLTQSELESERFALRLLFSRKMVNRPGQADAVVEFVAPDSEIAKALDKQFWVKKEVERQKYRPKDVVAKVREAGFSRFRIQPDHLELWKAEDAKNPAKNFGVEVAGTWYWYESWVARCVEICGKSGSRYRA
jgi:hypothetical protein